MDIGGISSALSAVKANPSTNTLGGAVGIKMLANSLDNSKQMSDGMVKMMENSVTPNVGSNFDVSV